MGSGPVRNDEWSALSRSKDDDPLAGLLRKRFRGHPQGRETGPETLLRSRRARARGPGNVSALAPRARGGSGNGSGRVAQAAQRVPKRFCARPACRGARREAFLRVPRGRGERAATFRGTPRSSERVAGRCSGPSFAPAVRGIFGVARPRAVGSRRSRLSGARARAASMSPFGDGHAAFLASVWMRLDQGRPTRRRSAFAENDGARFNVGSGPGSRLARRRAAPNCGRSV